MLIRNKLGLHARPAMQFVELANMFRAAVRVETLSPPPTAADGKSVMQMIVLAAVEGTPIRITASGEDAQAAVDKLAALIEGGFGEEM
ncbi:MAG: HPr family phosphocarrier protein [Tepidisphaerales bacterium]